MYLNCSINVRKYLDKRFGGQCRYTLRKGHPTEIVVGNRSLCDPANEDEMVVPVHIFSGRKWFLAASYPSADTCHGPPRSVFLESVSPSTCLKHVDFEWVECREKSLPRHGQTILSFCHETPFSRIEPTANMLDCGSGLCSVIPTSWTPRLSYLTALDPVPLEKKRDHPLITSMMSHAFSTMRKSVTHALIDRKVSFQRFGSAMRTTTPENYLKSFDSWPRIRDAGSNAGRDLKLNAIRWSKFHLAMEHSSMYGYTSEKVWQALRAGTVPVYYGGRDVKFLLPPKSTIFVGDYETLDAMIDHLEYLDGNDTAYNEYLHWRKDAQDPAHPWTVFMEHNGLGISMIGERMCVANEIGADVLKEYRDFGRVEPFERHWTDWTTGTTCYIPDGGCDGRMDIREEPKLVCDGPPPDLSLYEVDQVLWNEKKGRFSQTP
eukprot:TRINITY_DN935_c0_g1_i1.p1 TRINITY_DN935_c0_g1~~TRINITY_DN935_c0_g1_i1.p1  ORF type:complete len:433 (+),score=54.90 TRINITY_DN935_c0_g1_i1:517-1815(+)